MAVDKISVSIDRSLVRRIRQIAKRERVSVSALTSRALEREEKLDAMRRAIADYESEHGGITEEEMRSVEKTVWPD